MLSQNRKTIITAIATIAIGVTSMGGVANAQNVANGQTVVNTQDVPNTQGYQFPPSNAVPQFQEKSAPAASQPGKPVLNKQVSSVQPASVQPASVQPARVQPARVQPARVQPARVRPARPMSYPTQRPVPYGARRAPVYGAAPYGLPNYGAPNNRRPMPGSMQQPRYSRPAAQPYAMPYNNRPAYAAPYGNSYNNRPAYGNPYNRGSYGNPYNQGSYQPYNNPYNRRPSNNGPFDQFGGGPFNGNNPPWEEWPFGAPDSFWNRKQNPFKEQNPTDWFQPEDPKEGMAVMWDDLIAAPDDLGTMPGGWTVPSVRVPNPVDLEDQLERASKEVPDLIQVYTD